MSAKSAPTSTASSNSAGSMLSLTTRIVSCIPSPTNRSRLIERTSCARPSPGGLRMKNAAEKYSILSEVSNSGRSPLIVSFRQDRKRVSSAKSPSTLPCRSPSSSQMQKVAPSRIRSCSGIAHDPSAVRLDEPRVDGRDPDRPSEQILAERVGEAADGEFRGHVDRAVRVRLATGDRAEIDDVTAVAEVRQAEAGDSGDPVHVCLEDGALVVLRALVERLPPERESGGVDEDVDPVARRLGDEVL